jgi:hypothetical protein
MQCRRFSKEISGIMDGREITDSLTIKHIKECASCAKEYRVTLAMKKAMSLNEKTNIPDDFNSRVWKKIEEPPPSIFDRILGARLNTVFVLRTAAAAIAIVFVVVMAKNTIVKNEMAVLTDKSHVYASHVKLAKKWRSQEALKNRKENIINAGDIKTIENNPADAALVVNAVPVVSSKTEAQPNETLEKRELAPQNRITLAFKSSNAAAADNVTVKDNYMTAASVKNEPERSRINVTVADLKEPVEIKNNVFNPLQGKAMEIKYQVKTFSTVIIKVFNKKGENVKIIFNGSKTPGIYQDKWDGTDDTGTIVAAGMYIVYVKTDLAEKKIKTAVVK